MQPETPKTEKVDSIYQTLLNRNRGGESGKSFLSEAILRSLNRSYSSFSKRFPELADYIFDSIGNKVIATEMIKFFQPEKEPSPSVITRTWAELLPFNSYEQSSSYLLEAATTFIELIYFDFLKEHVLKSLLMHKYDTSLEHLSDNTSNFSEPKNAVPKKVEREQMKVPSENETSEEEQSQPNEDSSSITQIILTPSMRVDPTPDYLSQSITPYLIAIANLQLVINEILGRPAGKVLIKSISQNSPIAIKMDGAAEAIKLIMEIIIPWRRKHAQVMAQLLEQESMAEIESKKADILEKRAHAEMARAEASKQRVEAEKLKLECEKLRAELQGQKFQLGLNMLTSINPAIPRDDRITLLSKLATPIEMISMNELDLSIIE